MELLAKKGFPGSRFQKTNIVLVGDDDDQSFLIKYFLENKGFSIHVVKDGRDLISWLAQNPVQMILFDIVLNGEKPNLEVCRNVRKIEEFVRLPIIIISAYARTSDIVEGFRAGADDYITKPFHKEELAVRIEALLKRANYNGAAQTTALPTVGDESHAELILNQASIDQSQQLDEMQNQLILAEKMAVVGQLAAGIAHEIRNPLNIISTSSYFLKRVVESDNPKVSDHLDIIVGEIGRAQRIINSLLEFSRTTGSGRYQVDANKIIDTALTLLKKELVIQDIKVSTDYKYKGYCLANEDDIKQVVLNLILNAKQAMPQGGTLDIASAKLNDEFAVYTFKDTGIGIAEEDIDRIFDPFFSTKAMAGRGTGVGLSITVAALKRNNGTISVESELGQGTIFTVKLPIKD